MKNEESRCYHAKRRIQVIHVDGFSHVKIGEQCKYGHRDDFLYDFELGEAERPVSNPIGWHLERILKERNAPTCQNGDDERFVIQVLEVTIPRKCHKYIRPEKQNDCFHILFRH
jgi:hypothetical protein